MCMASLAHLSADGAAAPLPSKPGVSQGVKTLIIVLCVVVGLFGFVGTMAFVFVLDKPDEPRWEKARSDMAQIHQALNRYSLDNAGAYPASLSALTSKYFPNGVPHDPFTKTVYTYRLTPGGFELVCLGKDQAVGGKEKPNIDIVFDQAGEVVP